MKNFKSEMCYSVNTKFFLIFCFLSLVLFNSGSFSKKGLRAYLPVWSPDENELAYTQGIDKTQQIFKVDIDSRVVEQLTHHGNNHASDWFDPAVLPVQPNTALLTTMWSKLKQE